MSKQRFEKRRAGTGQHIYVLPLLLLIAALSFPVMKALAVDDAATTGAPLVSPCSGRYLPGAHLFTKEIAQGLVAAPETLKPYIKSISNKRYWGLAGNLRLKTSDKPDAPFILELKIPKGAINPGNKTAPRGGAGYHWTPDVPQNTLKACLTYSVWFPKDYDFVKGGKLPGIFGGMGPSGGKLVTGKNGFSTRYMWRKNGQGEVYAYIIGNNKRGISIDRGAWYFQPGAWTRVEQEVVLNKLDRDNGEVRVWVNGELVINRSGLTYRTVKDVTISGVMAHVFFGGKDPSWASTKDTIVRMTPFDLRWLEASKEEIRAQSVVK